MGFVDKLKGISTWQTVVTICFYIAAVLSLTIVAIMYDIIWLIAAGATTLGIVAGSLTGIATKTFSVVNPGDKEEEVSIQDIEELRICLADTRNELLALKSKVGDFNNEQSR